MEYEPVIALEIHAHIRTRSKQFCRCPAANTRELAEANKYVCPVCLGHPGVLPVLNEESVILAMAFGMRIGAEIAQRSIFARKHYFYPDLPKGYQITQYKTPLVSSGELEYRENGTIKTAKLQRAHLEEDTAKIFYQADGGVMLDYNRAGIPLLEIVTEPCFKSASEAVAFAEELRKVLKEMGVSEASMEDGSFRCEPNISVRPVGEAELRTKTEVKNLNSFAIIRKALDSEYHRQVALYKAGECVQPCTMRWDEGQGRTIPMRSKETQADYRYFDEPDLPPLLIEDEQLNEAKSRYGRSSVAISYRGDERRFLAGSARLVDFLSLELSLHERDAMILVENRDLLELLLSSGQVTNDYSTVAGIILNELRPTLVAHPELRGRIDAGGITELGKLLQARKLSYGQMKAVLNEVLTTGCTVGEAYKKLGFDQQVGGGDLTDACAKVIASNEKAVADIRKGKSAALQVLVGQVMKVTRGKAKPEEAVTELKKQLGL
jgi:aspartyl-tRNA(Asn)/glutamyl-tRNA(Gln) amidotransferase subunit B